MVAIPLNINNDVVGCCRSVLTRYSAYIHNYRAPPLSVDTVNTRPWRLTQVPAIEKGPITGSPPSVNPETLSEIKKAASDEIKPGLRSAGNSEQAGNDNNVAER